MPTIIPREQANLPPMPSSIGHRTLASWAGIRVHHTGGAFSSWRAVHDWQTEGRDEDDQLDYIGYSFGIANGRVTELRGWDHHPAHDHINTHLGVCLGGSFMTRLPSAADLEALVWFIRRARARTGARLPVDGHRDVSRTACPGDRLYAHLPTIRARADEEEDNMPTVKEIWESDIIEKPPGYPDSDETHWRPSSMIRSSQYWSRRGARRVDELAAGQAAILAAVAGEDQAAAVRAELDRHRGLLLGELAELEDRLVEALPDVPAEQVRAAVRAELAGLRLVTEPAE